jgi:hypothetical protein
VSITGNENRTLGNQTREATLSRNGVGWIEEWPQDGVLSLVDRLGWFEFSPVYLSGVRALLRAHWDSMMGVYYEGSGGYRGHVGMGREMDHVRVVKPADGRGRASLVAWLLSCLFSDFPVPEAKSMFSDFPVPEAKSMR